jgi:hypothetical protein
MKKTIQTLLFVAAFSSGGALACDLPQAPTLPKGGEATMEEMVAGQGSVKSYQKALATYRDCVSADIDSAKAAMKEASDADEVKRLNAQHESAVSAFNKAVELEEKVAGQFNVEIRAFKAKNK